MGSGSGDSSEPAMTLLLRKEHGSLSFHTRQCGSSDVLSHGGLSHALLRCSRNQLTKVGSNEEPHRNQNVPEGPRRAGQKAASPVCSAGSGAAAVCSSTACDPCRGAGGRAPLGNLRVPEAKTPRDQGEAGAGGGQVLQQGKQSPEAYGGQEQSRLTIGPASCHLMELLPGERSLHMLDVLPGPACALLLDSILQKGLQGQQHAHHILG